MTAPAPSPAEQAVIERFGIFDEERVVEEVARAIHDADEWDCSVDWPCANANLWRRLAAAAVTAYRATQDGGAEEAELPCGGRGPRIGSEGQPICRQPQGHAGPHRPAADDGWGDVTWNDFS